MVPGHHNPGKPIMLELGEDSAVGFSISALATYVLFPGLNCAFDMGECPVDAVPLEHVFLSHAHGDHSRCLLRHESLRRLMGMAPATYHIPAETMAGFQELSKAWKTLENVGEKKFDPPRYNPLVPGDTVWLHRQLAAKAFRVHHSLPSLGYTLYDVRKKLMPEFQDRTGRELGQLRQEGVVFEEEHWLPRITYIGDSTIDTLHDEPHVGKSRVLLMELTYLMEDDREMARRRGHTHLDDLLELIESQPDFLQNEHIVLKHFSMRYDRRLILSILKKRLPKVLEGRVHLMV